MKENKHWFIKDKKVRWVHTFIKQNIEYDNSEKHLVVSMENNLNSPSLNDCKIEEIQTDSFYVTKEAAQFEIIRRERFEE